MTALTAGMFGVMAASYGNAVLGSFPTGVLIYISMALMLNAEVLDKETAQENLPAAIPDNFLTFNDANNKS